MTAVLRKQKGLTSKEKVSQRFANIAAVLTRTDRIVTANQTLTVQIAELPMKTPGFSDGRTITINRTQFENIADVKTLVRISGLNYHEVAHCMFTPRKESSGRGLVNQVIVENAFQSFNALEDQRIETLFTALYGSAAKYFAEMVVGFLVDDEETWPFAALLTHGRKFLPLSLREAFEDKFIGDDEQLQRGKDIIDEYRLLDVLKEEQRALELVRAYHKLLREIQASVPPVHQQGDNPETGGCAMNNTDGRPDREATKNATEKAEEDTAEQEELEEQGQDGSGFYDDVEDELSEAQDELEEGDSEDSAGSGSDSSDSEEGGDDDGDGTDGGEGADSDDYDESGSEDNSSSGGSGADSGEGSNGPLTDDELANMLEDVLSDIMNSGTVKSDTRRLKGAVASDMPMDNAPRSDRYDAPASADLVRTSNAVEREVSRLRAQMEPGWQRGATSGRLNVHLAMNAEIGDDEIFDQWDEGQEQNAGLEAVILVDASGSMAPGWNGNRGNPIGHACEAMWVLKRAMEAQDAHVTVLTFSDGYRELFGRHEQADRGKVPYVRASGGTGPEDALKRARAILAATDKPNRLLVITSDGEWNGGPELERSHTLVKGMPATTLFIGMGKAVAQGTTHECDLAAHVDDPLELVPVIRQTVTQMLRTHL